MKKVLGRAQTLKSEMCLNLSSTTYQRGGLRQRT